MLYINKFANYKYSFEKEYEAGMVLTGIQVKELRKGKMNLKEANVKIIKDEIWVLNTGLSEDKVKLLLNRSELNKIKIFLDEKRHHVFPVGIFQKGRILKLKIATGIVKTQYQKTEQQKRKDVKIKIAKAFREKDYDSY